MANTNRLIPFTKAWNYADGNYGEKEYWLNPGEIIKGVEACKLKKNGKEVDCTKVYYECNFIILVGTVADFFIKCKQSNTAIHLLHELESINGVSIKEFLIQMGIKNGVELT